MKRKSIWLLAVALMAISQLASGAGEWKQVGKKGDWVGTIAGATINQKIYTTESNGALYVTDPSGGSWKQLGKPEFKNTKFMFAAGAYIYTIETSGTLYQISI